MNLVVASLAAAVLCVPALGQLTHVIPNGLANTAANSNNAFPWAGSSVSWAGLRTTCIYDAAHFTDAGINVPIAIHRLRWRAAPTTSSWTGGTFAQVTVRMATAAVAPNAISTTQAANFGPDLMVVSTGPVAFLPGTGNGPGVPGPWVVDLPLATPFVYDPLTRSLAIDVDISNSGGPSWSGGTTPQLDVDVSSAARAGRLFASSMYPATNGTTFPHGVVVEVSYAPLNTGPYAMRTNYGRGCHDRARSYYELFPSTAAFNLAGSASTPNTIEHVYNTTTYLVRPGSGQWRTPTSTALALGEDSEVARALPFNFPYPGGFATQLMICSNGFVSPGFSNGTAGTASTSQLLTGGPRYCAWWHDLSPPTGGQVFFDVDVPSSTAWVTWNNVATRNGGGSNTFQMMFTATGTVEFRYQAMSGQSSTNASVLVGWSPGGSVRDPGSRPIATSLPFSTDLLESTPLQLNASARPILGTSINLVTANIPAGTVFGALIRSFTRHDPGLPLASIGMPDCFQNVGLDTTDVFFAAGSSFNFAVNIPNSPVHAGTLVRCQAATFTPGVNPLGVLSSNGVELRLNPQ